jgi:hypothetical protein
MKNRVVWITIILTFFSGVTLMAAWTEPVLVDTAAPFLPGPRILAKGDSLAVVFGNDRFKRSLDLGESWQDDYVLPDGHFPYEWRDLKPQGDTLVIYSIYGPSHNDLAFYYSVDFGQTWMGPRECEDCHSLGYFSSQFDGNLMSICNVMEFTGDIYIVNSTDFGITWGEPQAIYSYDDITIPLLNYFYGFTYIVAENEHSTLTTILNLLFSTDGGDSWIHIDSLVTEGYNWFVSMDASSGGQMAFVYNDYNSNIGPESWVNVCVSSDSGFTWSSPIDLSVGDRSKFPRVALFGDTLVVTFQGYVDSVAENPSVFVGRSYDLGQNWESLEILTDPEQYGIYPDVFIDGGKIHIVYHVGTDGIYYRRWEPETGTKEDIYNPIAPLVLTSYPNPFNAKAIIQYQLPSAGQVEIAIYDVLGQRAETLVDGRQEAGTYRIAWDSGGHPSGVYFVRLNTSVGSESRKVLLLK